MSVTVKHRREEILSRAGRTLFYVDSIAVADLPKTIALIEPHVRCRRTYGVDLRHEAACPCGHGAAPIDRCVCKRVELHVFEVRA